MLYNSPVAVAILGIVLVVALFGAVRYWLRSGDDQELLDQAEEEGRLSPVVREIWESNRREYALTLLGIALFLALLMWVVDQDLQP